MIATDNAALPEAGSEDSALMALPARGPLSPLTMFVTTYRAKLGNLHISCEDLTRRMCATLHAPLVAFNSNYGHACQPGYESLLKARVPPPERLGPMRGRLRKEQGDGTCFNSAVEPIIVIADHPGISEYKVYKVKCFPTTGETQIPGVICADLSDGRAVLETFVRYLNQLGVGDVDPGGGGGGAEPRRLPVTAINENPNMLNYKFFINRTSDRTLVNLRKLALYMNCLELTKAVQGGGLKESQAALFAEWTAVVLPPYPVRETKPPTDDIKVSFHFQVAKREPRINIFQGGKINILGADSAESADRIYNFFVQLFMENWTKLICLQPRSDVERRAARAAELPAAATLWAACAVRTGLSVCVSPAAFAYLGLA